MAKTTTLKTKQGDKLYPQTTASVVITDRGNVADDLNTLYARTDKNKGYYKSLAQLQQAHPTANSGDWAIVDEIGKAPIHYAWDSDINEWKESGYKPSGIMSVNAKTDADIVLGGGDIKSTINVNNVDSEKTITQHLQDHQTAIENIPTTDNTTLETTADNKLKIKASGLNNMINHKEDKSNKVSYIDAFSDHIAYPTAKAVFEALPKADGITLNFDSYTKKMSVRTVCSKYTATIPTENWVGTEAPYTIQLTVNGLTENSNVDLDLDLSNTLYEDIEAIQSCYAKIYRAVNGNNTLTIYASEIPTIAIPIKLKVVL